MIWLYMRIATALFPKSLQHAKKGSTRPLLIIGAKEAYHELFQLQERAKKLRKVREELELRTNLRKKGVAIQVAEGSKSKPAQYRWLYDRKR
ncbi:unnamed protein product [Symbiodinium necroappetens]|uniref:Uncharacterized protein n=1 Tax=Symbiodinium necroappetens TaxID=1628268 RepID=A0A812TI43_9DINO|nr:unnamed protein product [Symbiodinium necroappetens]